MMEKMIVNFASSNYVEHSASWWVCSTQQVTISPFTFSDLTKETKQQIDETLENIKTNAIPIKAVLTNVMLLPTYSGVWIPYSDAPETSRKFKPHIHLNAMDNKVLVATITDDEGNTKSIETSVLLFYTLPDSSNPYGYAQTLSGSFYSFSSVDNPRIDEYMGDYIVNFNKNEK